MRANQTTKSSKANQQRFGALGRTLGALALSCGLVGGGILAWSASADEGHEPAAVVQSDQNLAK